MLQKATYSLCIYEFSKTIYIKFTLGLEKAWEGVYSDICMFKFGWPPKFTVYNCMTFASFLACVLRVSSH